MDEILIAFVNGSKQFNEEIFIKIDEKTSNSLSAADHKRLLSDTVSKFRDNCSMLKTEIECVLKLKKSNVENLKIKIDTIKELSNLLNEKKEKSINQKLPEIVEIKENTNENNSNENDQDGGVCNGGLEVLRKPRLSDYNFSRETLALIKNDVVLTNSSIKPPNLNDYDFYSKSFNDIKSKIISDKKTLKITPAIFVTDSEDSDQKTEKSKKSLMHSGSLDGSLIKLTPRNEFDFNFDGQKLLNPDFDSAGDDTTSVTIIEKPEIPSLGANYNRNSEEIFRPEFPQLLARELYESPQIEQNKPTIGFGAFKPVEKREKNGIGEKRDVRRSVAPDMNVTYVVSKTDESNLTDKNVGKILSITRQEYSSLESFYVSKISFNELYDAVTSINVYLETQATDLLTKLEFVEILPNCENLHILTLILTKFGRLKRLQAEETYFECA